MRARTISPAALKLDQGNLNDVQVCQRRQRAVFELEEGLRPSPAATSSAPLTFITRTIDLVHGR